jgi:hypothetical protein
MKAKHLVLWAFFEILTTQVHFRVPRYFRWRDRVGIESLPATKYHMAILCSELRSPRALRFTALKTLFSPSK